MAAALLMSASLPSRAAVVYSTSGTVDGCNGGVCYLTVNVGPLGPSVQHSAPLNGPDPWSGNFVVNFTAQSPLLGAGNYFTTSWAEDYYTDTGTWLPGGDDTYMPGCCGYAPGQISGNNETLSFTEFLTRADVPCGLAFLYPTCVGVRYTQSYLDNVQVELGGAAAGETWYLTVSSVPEPATWGLLIAGLALLGASFRSRTSQIRRAEPLR